LLRRANVDVDHIVARRRGRRAIVEAQGTIRLIVR
jgi:hypothetical protein